MHAISLFSYFFYFTICSTENLTFYLYPALDHRFGTRVRDGLATTNK